MEPGNRSFRALVVVFGGNPEYLSSLIEGRILQLLDYWSYLDPDKQWVWLEGEGTPNISVCQADHTVLSRNFFDGYDYYFLAGELDSKEARDSRKIIRDLFVEKEFYMTFLLPNFEFGSEPVLENECLITQPGRPFLSEAVIAEFIHDFCAFEIMPNMISVDLADFGRPIRAKRVCLEYFDYDSEKPAFKLSSNLVPNFLFAVIFIDPIYDILEIVGDLMEHLIKLDDLNLFFTDVAFTGKNLVMCLYS